MVFSPYWNIPDGHRRRRRFCRRSRTIRPTSRSNNIEVDDEERPLPPAARARQLARAGEVPLSEPLQRLPARHAGAGAVRPGRARLQPRLRAARRARWILRSTCFAISPSGPTTKIAAAMNAGDGTLGRAEAAAPDLPRVLHRVGRERRAEDACRMSTASTAATPRRRTPNDGRIASCSSSLRVLVSGVPRCRATRSTKFDTKTAGVRVSFHGETIARIATHRSW